MKKFAVIVAAGTGSRMGNAIPKQFLELSGKPLLLHTLESFVMAYPDISIVLVAHPGYQETTRQLIEKTGYLSSIRLIPGGATRSDSVRAGLRWVPDDSVVLVHDAARCLVSPQLIISCYEAALEKGNAIPVVSVSDSVRMITGKGSESVNRDNFRLVQTPQAFWGKLLKDAYNSNPGQQFTDDASVLEHAGVALNLVPGDPANIKITHPVDLIIAAQLKKHSGA